MSFRVPVFFILVGTLACLPAAAQSQHAAPVPTSRLADSSETSHRVADAASFRPSSLSLWIGGSTTTGGIIGKVPDGQFGLVGLRYSRTLGPASTTSSSHSVRLTYTLDLFPAAFLSIPPAALPKKTDEPADGQTDPHKSPRRQSLDVFGFGASPVGFRINFLPEKRIQPFIASSAGFIYFMESIPTARGRHLNFTADVGLGLQMTLTRHSSLLVGYRYHHLSNGFRGQINPGVDANLFYLGISIPE